MKERNSGKLFKMISAVLFVAFVLACGPAFAELIKDDIDIVKARQKYKNGPSADPNFFPLMVWAQSPENAGKYKAIGINTYIGLHGGPKPGQIEALKAAGMNIICHMNEEALKFKNDKAIISWLIIDEPENWRPTLKTLKVADKTWELNLDTAPVKRVSSKVMGEMYDVIKSKDDTRPVWVNFGCGLANKAYGGRGGGWKDSMYPDYMKFCDMISYDVYPVSDSGERYLWWQAKGLDKLKEYNGPDKPRANCIGTNFTGDKKAPTPENTKTEIWISIIHGSKGIIYFCHNFKPKFQEAALLEDPKQRESVKKINEQITALAPVINSLDYDGAAVTSSDEKFPIDILVKRYKDETYIFAAVMKMGDPVTGAFQVKGVSAAGKVEVIGEGRTLEMDAKGQFKDEFKKWETHNYRIIK